MNTLLNEILNAREARAFRQQALLRRFQRPVVCFTMNIAGPVKTSPLIRRAFDAGLSALENGKVTSLGISHYRDNDEAFDAASEALKTILSEIK